jgi:hypothetical protein
MKFILALVTLFIVGCAANAPAPAAKSTLSRDAQALAELKSAGSNVEKPHAVDFFLYVPSQKEADAAFEELQKSGYSVSSKQTAAGTQWLCLANKTMVPNLENLAAVRKEMEALAAKYKGEYDGWEAATVK